PIAPGDDNLLLDLDLPLGHIHLLQTGVVPANNRPIASTAALHVLAPPHANMARPPRRMLSRERVAYAQEMPAFAVVAVAAAFALLPDRFRRGVAVAAGDGVDAFASNSVRAAGYQRGQGSETGDALVVMNISKSA
ncbi:MAG: hypothetical protein LQ348_006849, partial [Seirophora lacunosa]